MNEIITAPGMLIDGALREGTGRLAVRNPATGQVCVEVPRASPRELEDAVSAAKRAQPAWAARTWDERRSVMLAMADVIAANASVLARLLTLEQGKPLPEAAAEIGGLEYFFRHMGALEQPGSQLEDSVRRDVRLIYRPLGVVAAIIPWNFPLMILGFKLPPALLAGNTVILKPAPTTPLATLRFCELVAPLLPAGVLNVIVDDNDLGPLLTAHPDIAKISFTGSTATGARVMQSAAATIKRLTLELGGNDPAIVLDDVDPAAVAPALYGNAFLNAGQVCVAIKRIYVPAALHDKLADELATLARQAIVGDGMAKGTTMGPLQNDKQRRRVLALLDEAQQGGARIEAGAAPQGEGYFLAPTIVCDADPASRIVTEEQFGPVLPLVKYDNVDEVIAQVNAEPFGLGASVWSRDPVRARIVAERIDAGTVWVNGHMDLDPAIPFAGVKQSGLGTEFGTQGLEEFMAIKVINEIKP